MSKRRSSGPLLVLVILNILIGLSLEAFGAKQGWAWAEPLVGLITLLHLSYYLYRPPRIGRMQLSRAILLTCLLLATAGELILSAFWGLYAYRVSTLPIFVPPGHVLLFMSGLAIAQHERCGNWVGWGIPLLALPFLSLGLWDGGDIFSLFLFALFLVCLLLTRDRKLYSVMFVLALLLELYGTTLNSWQWARTIPLVNISTANPPFAAGVFYALLDLLTMKLRIPQSSENTE